MKNLAKRFFSKQQFNRYNMKNITFTESLMHPISGSPSAAQTSLLILV